MAMEAEALYRWSAYIKYVSMIFYYKIFGMYEQKKSSQALLQLPDVQEKNPLNYLWDVFEHQRKLTRRFSNLRI